MKTMKKNAALVLISIFCAVMVLPCIFTSCTNGEEFDITTNPLPPVRDTVYVVITDTMWNDTTIYVPVIKHEGVKAVGEPWLEKINDDKYKTYYQFIVDGEDILAQRELKVAVSVGAEKDIYVTNDSIIGMASFSKGNRSTKSYTSGDYAMLTFDANGNYTFANGFMQYVNTVYEFAWYKGFQMLAYWWEVEFKEVRYSIGKPYTHEGVEGKLFTDTLVWEANYGPEDIRELKRIQKFFVPTIAVEPDPEAKRRYAKDENFITTSNTSGESTFILWEELNNGKNIEVANITSTVKFRLENAKGVVIDLSKDQEFKLSDLTAVEGSEKPVGEPRVVNGISIQEYVTEYTTEYTTETNKSKSVFYMYTEKHTFLNPENLGGNIIMKVGKLSFEDKGTSKLIPISDEGNFERMQSTSTIVAKYHDRELTGTGTIILRKAKSEEPQPKPEKELDRITEKSFDGNDTYVITRFYKDGTYSDTTVVNNYGYEHKLIMPTLERIIPRDNTNFGEPTISKDGAATEIGSSKTREGLVFQGISQIMNSVYSGHSHKIELQYTALQYTEGGLKCNLTVPMWTLTHKENKPGTVRQEVENNRNYDVTPISFRYNGAFGKGASSVYNTDTEVWNDKGQITTITGYIGKNFGFDYVDAGTSYTYATFYSIMSDGTEKELGKDGVNVYNSIEVPNPQIINTDNFDLSEYKAVPGSKVFVSYREVACKFGGKFVVNKYKTLYTTKTNKTEIVFTAYHEEATYVPTIGNSFPMDYREYKISDLGITPLTDIGRVNGRDGKKYDSQISASYNDRSGGILKAEVQLWVKTANKYGIDTNLANVGMTHTFDYGRAHHIATVVRYENSDGTGGLKGFIDGKEVVKATWDEVNKPTGQVSLAQNGGAWVLCTVAETSDKNSYAWRSLMKSNSGAGITSIDKRHMVVLGYQEIYIPSAATENADGTVTITSAAGSVNVGAW